MRNGRPREYVHAAQLLSWWGEALNLDLLGLEPSSLTTRLSCPLLGLGIVVGAQRLVGITMQPLYNLQIFVGCPLHPVPCFGP